MWDESLILFSQHSPFGRFSARREAFCLLSGCRPVEQPEMKAEFINRADKDDSGSKPPPFRRLHPVIGAGTYKSQGHAINSFLMPAATLTRSLGASKRPSRTSRNRNRNRKWHIREREEEREEVDGPVCGWSHTRGSSAEDENLVTESEAIENKENNRNKEHTLQSNLYF